MCLNICLSKILFNYSLSLSLSLSLWNFCFIIPYVTHAHTFYKYSHAEAYSEPCQTFKMVDFAKTLLLSCLTEFWTCLCHALLNLKKQPPEVFYVKRPATLLKRRLWHRCFPVNFVKFLRTSFLHNTSERLLLDLIIYPFIYLDTHLVICVSLFISSIYSMIYVFINIYSK